MRIKHIALFAAVAVALVTLPASAAPLDPQAGAGQETVEVRVIQPRQVQLAPLMFDRVQGEYALEDGRTLAITGQRGGEGSTRSATIYADLGDGPVEMVHVGRNRFVAVGQDLTVRFQANGRIPETVFVTDAGGRQVASTQR